MSMPFTSVDNSICNSPLSFFFGLKTQSYRVVAYFISATSIRPKCFSVLVTNEYQFLFSFGDHKASATAHDRGETMYCKLRQLMMRSVHKLACPPKTNLASTPSGTGSN